MTPGGLLAAALLLLAACGEPTAPEPAPDPELEGTYTLRAIDGKTLPWVQLVLGQDTTWVLGGSYTFRADSTYTFTYIYRYLRDGEVTVQHYQDEGRYQAFGDSLRLIDWWDYGARREGNTLVVHGRYEDWIYRR